MTPLVAETRPPCCSTTARTIDRPRPDSAAPRVARGVDAVEAVEHVRQVLGRDARPAVLDDQHDLGAGRRRPQRDAAAARRVAHGVGDQVLQHLLEPPLVAKHGFGARADVPFERDAALVERALVPGERALEQAGERDRLALERSTAAVETGEVEEVADDGLEAQRLLGDDAEIAGAGRVVLHGRRQRQGLEVAAHRGERRHQLVRDVGEQLAARAIGIVQLLHAGVEIGGHAIEAAGERRHFVAAVLGGADRGLAGADRGRGLLEPAQAAVHRPEHEDGHHRGAGDEQRQCRRNQCRAELGKHGIAALRRRQHADDRDRPAADDDRLERRPSRPHRAVLARRPAVRRRTQGRGHLVDPVRDAQTEPRHPGDEGRHLERSAAVDAIAAHDEDAVRTTSELARQPGVDVEAGVRFERAAQLGCGHGGDPRRPHADGVVRRGQPEEQRRLQDQHARDGRNEADGDPPVEAAIPDDAAVVGRRPNGGRHGGRHGRRPQTSAAL